MRIDDQESMLIRQALEFITCGHAHHLRALHRAVQHEDHWRVRGKIPRDVSQEGSIQATDANDAALNGIAGLGPFRQGRGAGNDTAS
jgi:hypothetical protein